MANELSRFILLVEHFLLDRIESDFFRCLRFQTNFIGVDIFFISASSGQLRWATSRPFIDILSIHF